MPDAKLKYGMFTVWERNGQDVTFGSFVINQLEKESKKYNLTQKDIDMLARASLLGIQQVKKMFESIKKGVKPPMPVIPETMKNLRLHLPKGRIIMGNGIVVRGGQVAEAKESPLLQFAFAEKQQASEISQDFSPT